MMQKYLVNITAKYHVVVVNFELSVLQLIYFINNYQSTKSMYAIDVFFMQMDKKCHIYLKNTRYG